MKPYPTIAAALAFCLALLCAAAVAEDAAARAVRFDNLVESLNAASERRSQAIELIYAELKGPHSREMQELLRETLRRSNTLILQGALEAVALFADPRDLPGFEALLATSHSLEVKTLAIRLVPAFSLFRSERARINYINFAAGYSRVAGPGVLEPLRRPPITRRGGLDADLDRMRVGVTRILTSQFDPVAAALAYVDDALYGFAVRRKVEHYVGNALGSDPAKWRRGWSERGGAVKILVPEELEEVRLAALDSLADMGAEGLPEVVDGFGKLLAEDSRIVIQACFETMKTMCGTAYAAYETVSGLTFEAETAAAGENWRKRIVASATRLALFAAREAGRVAERGEGDNAMFSLAVGCIGEALAFPPGFPDPDGELDRARTAGLALLERLAMRPDLTPAKREAVARALGRVGLERGARVLAGILDSPYASPGRGDEGMRMAAAVVDALAAVAQGPRPGREQARNALLDALSDSRVFPSSRPESPPVGMGHLVLWRLQRVGRTNDISLDPAWWRSRLGW